MGKFSRDSRSDGKKKFGNDRGFRRDDRTGRSGLHKAICSECGKTCEVPFRPTGDKPIYCSECFEQRDTSSRKQYGGRDFGRVNLSDRPMFKAVCDKCHKTCEVPFRPTGEKPVYCSDCFGDKSKDDRLARGSKTFSIDQYQKEFAALNSKLDSILKILSPKNKDEKKEGSEINAVQTEKEATKKTLSKKDEVKANKKISEKKKEEVSKKDIKKKTKKK